VTTKPKLNFYPDINLMADLWSFHYFL